MKKSYYLVVGILAMQSLFAQNNSPWRGKKCAVVLTYDDAYNEQLDNAIPVLDSLGLKATFYITGFSTSMQSRLEDWKKIAANGHELGNHTMYHPCIGKMPGREWVTAEHDLSNYSVQRIVEETRATNLLLQAMDGKTRRTFAFPCADTKIGDSSYGIPLQKDFAALRNVRSQMHPIDKVNLNDVDCYMVNGESGEQLIEWAKKAEETNSLLVILFHGVGGGNSLNVDVAAHRQFLSWLKQNEKDIWVAPMIEVADYIKTWQTNDKAVKIQQQATQVDYKNMLAQLHITSTRPGPSGKNWQQQLLEQGWGFAIIVPTSYQADNGAHGLPGLAGIGMIVNKKN